MGKRDLPGRAHVPADAPGQPWAEEPEEARQRVGRRSRGRRSEGEDRGRAVGAGGLGLGPLRGSVVRKGCKEVGGENFLSEPRF